MRLVLSVVFGGVVLLLVWSTLAVRQPPSSTSLGAADGPFTAALVASMPSQTAAPAAPAVPAIPSPPPDEARAVGALRAINAAESGYFATTNTYGRLDELFGMNLIEHRVCNATLPSTAYYGYVLRLAVLPPTPAPTYYIEAMPTGSSGSAHAFYTDEAGSVYQGTTPTHTHAAPGQGPPGFSPVGS